MKILEIKKIILELLECRSILFQLTITQLILKYRRTFLGFFWTLINPIMMMTVMALIFSQLFKQDLKSFTISLFAGMIPWNFFSSVVSQSTTSLINNEGLIKKIYIPKIIFPLSSACGLLIDSILSFCVLLSIIIIIKGNLSWALLFLPISFIMLFLFSLSLGLIVSIATVYFRDLQHIISISLQGLFFLTPILYKPELLAGKIKWLVELNPLFYFIMLFRMPIMDSVIPDKKIISISLTYTLILLIVSLFIYKKYEKKIIFRL